MAKAMAKAGKMKTFVAAWAVLPLLLGACDGKNSAGVDAAVSLQPSGQMATSEIPDYSPAAGGAGALTAIDAAISDASGMPDDSNEEVIVVTKSTAEDVAATNGPPPAASPLRPAESDLLPSVAE
jgi:hypothetical protein